MRIAYKALAAALAALALGPAAAHAAPPVGHFRVAIDTAAQTADYSHTAAAGDIVILQAYQAGLMHRLKAANPKLKALVYKNLSGMTSLAPWGIASTGVTTEDAASHSEWYLRNTGGERFTFQYYDWMWAADVGNAAWQQKWADNVLAQISADGWDGVFMDDANASMAYHYAVDEVAKYPSDAAYQAATESALQAIGGRFRAAGKLVVPNFGFTKNYPDVIDRWTGYVDGATNEQFVKWGQTPSADSYDPPSVFERQLRSMKAAEAQGKLYLGITHSAAGDTAAARYGYATALLAGNGHVEYAFHYDYTNETWLPEYDYAIGSPTAAETKEASGVHRRRFTDGLVLVNPTTSSVRVDFGGPYTGSGPSSATSTTMPPHTALVLAKTGDWVPFPDDAAGTDGPQLEGPGGSDGTGGSPGPIDSPGAGGSPAAIGSPSAGGPAPTAAPATASPRRLAVKVACHARRRCDGTVQLRRGRTVLAKRAVRLRRGRSITLRLAVAPKGTTARAAKLSVVAPRGARAALVR